MAAPPSMPRCKPKKELNHICHGEGAQISRSCSEGDGTDPQSGRAGQEEEAKEQGPQADAV